jgi:heat shock protein HslJ
MKTHKGISAAVVIVVALVAIVTVVNWGPDEGQRNLTEASKENLLTRLEKFKFDMNIEIQAPTKDREAVNFATQVKDFLTKENYSVKGILATTSVSRVPADLKIYKPFDKTVIVQIYSKAATSTTISVSSSPKLPAGSTPPGSSEAVIGSTWVWQTTVAKDAAVITPKKADAFTIVLSADNKITGKTDCNGFSGTYKIGSDGILSVGPLASTKMFCEGSQESVFTSAISKVQRYMVDAKGLTLTTESGVMTFKKQ